MRRYLIVLLLFFVSASFAYSASFSPKSHYTVCFTPGHYCTGDIVKTIRHSKKTILVQAYSFTSRAIGWALVRAKKRGVQVKIILDKSQFQPNHYSLASFFLKHHIPLFLDYRPTIAHNKVMVIDGKTVITGSFNFTVSAQRYNAENVLILHDQKIAKQYAGNWYRRLKRSIPVYNIKKIPERFLQEPVH